MMTSPQGAAAGGHDPEVVLSFWFPDRIEEDPQTHDAHWRWRMLGGADQEILSRFTSLTEDAAAGRLDAWATTPRGRLALVIALDQFPRSVWRDTPRAFEQDAKALALVLEGHHNGHYDTLQTPWERTIYNVPLGHYEGPNHLERLDLAIRLGQDILKLAPEPMKPIYAFIASQPVEVRRVIAEFGRHPHRNAALGRVSTPEEQAYLTDGRFPHLRTPDATETAPELR